MLTGKHIWEEFGDDTEAILKHLKDLNNTPSFEADLSNDCKDFLQSVFKIDPLERPTVDDLFTHPFLSMSDQEVKESLEASNFISFFSILASQKSVNIEGK